MTSCLWTDPSPTRRAGETFHSTVFSRCVLHSLLWSTPVLSVSWCMRVCTAAWDHYCAIMKARIHECNGWKKEKKTRGELFLNDLIFGSGCKVHPHLSWLPSMHLASRLLRYPQLSKSTWKVNRGQAHQHGSTKDMSAQLAHSWTELKELTEMRISDGEIQHHSSNTTNSNYSNGNVHVGCGDKYRLNLIVH